MVGIQGEGKIRGADVEHLREVGDGLGDETAREREPPAALGSLDLLLAKKTFSPLERIVDSLSEIQLIAIGGGNIFPRKVSIVMVGIGSNHCDGNSQ